MEAVGVPVGGVAFVTGSSSGIGAGLARRLARAGYAVGLAARRADRLEALAAEIERAGGRACVCPCDVSARDDVRAAIRRAEDDLGAVDLLVANAGVSERTYVESLDGRDVERVMKVNFLGAVYAVEAVLPAMLARGSGHLVAVGSITGYGGLPMTAAYSASKGALHNFFESLRIDLRRSGVAVTVVTPGYVRTEMTARNLHPMPFLVDLDDAVERIYTAIAGRRRLLSFPAPLAAVARFAAVLPAAWYDRVAGRVKRDQRAAPRSPRGRP